MASAYTSNGKDPDRQPTPSFFPGQEHGVAGAAPIGPDCAKQPSVRSSPALAPLLEPGILSVRATDRAMVGMKG